MKLLLLLLHRVAFRVLAPRDLRRDFGPDVRRLLRELLEATEPHGRVAMLRVWATEMLELVTTVQVLTWTAPKYREPVRRLIESLDDARRDARTTVHGLRRRPAFTLSVLATLCVGIGLTAVVHAAARVSVFSPLPVPDAGEVVVTTGWVVGPRGPIRTGITARELRTITPQAGGLSEFAVFSLGSDITLETGDVPARARVSFVGPDFFRAVRAEMALGRVLNQDDTADDRSVVLSHATWERRFGSDSTIVGRSVEMAGFPFTVVGVLSEAHWGVARRPAEFDAWLPLSASDVVLGPGALQSLTQGSFWGVGRLQPGVTRIEAERELRALHAAFAESNPLPEARSVSLMGLREFYFGGATGPLTAVSIGALIVLLISFANVAFLVHLRGRERKAEDALRTALGASRARLVRASVIEALLLGSAAGVFACILARWVSLWFAAGPGQSLLRFRPLEVQPEAWLVAPALASAILLASHVTELWSRPASPSSSRVTRRAPRFAGLVIGAEAALAMVLAVGVAMGARSLTALRDVALGYEPAGLGSVRVNLAGSPHEVGTRPSTFAQEVVDELERIPGVSAGAMGPDMMGRSVTHVHMTREGLDPSADANIRRIQWISLTPGTLATLGIELLEGRDVAWTDAESEEMVVILSERAAANVWPGESALGRRVHVNESPHAGATVVGIVRNARHNSRYAQPYLDGDAYFALAQKPTPRVSFLFRQASGTLDYTAVEEAVHHVDPGVALYDALSMERRVRGEETALRMVLMILLAYGAIALGLAVCGIVSLVATTGEDRHAELAIRSALGARRTQLVWEFTRLTVAAVGLGVLGGALFARVAVSRLAPVFFGVSPTDPTVYVVVGATVLALGGAAAWLPGLHTTKKTVSDVLHV